MSESNEELKRKRDELEEENQELRKKVAMMEEGFEKIEQMIMEILKPTRERVNTTDRALHVFYEEDDDKGDE